MKRLIYALALVTLSVAACGGDDDDDDNNNNTAGSSTGATSNNAGEPSTGDAGEPAGSSGGSGPTANVPCDPELEGVCQNPMDCPFVASGQARMTAGVCGQDCLLSGNTDEACPRDCLLEELEMSEECGGCYADAAVCGIMMCAAACIDDPEAEICQDCLIESGCREAFSTCSGLSG
jgi:hypothetical protein